MTLDINKPVRTKSGCAVRLIYTNMKNDDYPLVGIFTDEEGEEQVCTYTIDGLVIVGDEFLLSNLENVPEFQYKLVYKDGAVAPTGWQGGTDHEWLPSKRDFSCYAPELRLGWLKRENGDNNTTVFEPL